MLQNKYYQDKIEAGVDEAGRGCLAGSVFAAAVILPPGFDNPKLNDSKKLSERQRYLLRDEIIGTPGLLWAVAETKPGEIDKINILQASILAMHRALEKLKHQPEAIIVDGNRFKPYRNLPYTCIVKGDGKQQAIAAASILAKTYRDDYMKRLSEEYPQYGWNRNKGYPTQDHREAIRQHGITPYHRKTFTLLPQMEGDLFAPQVP